ncbi:MAG: hypothetical protein QM710_10300 [Flavobacterium sp.]
MKTLKITLLAAIGLFGSTAASAADLYVRDGGAGGAFSTISAAIAQASDGDRIIIKPKIGNAPYLETVTINKSLTLLSETNFAKYYVQGVISIVPAVDRVVTINNMYAYQSDIATSQATLSGGRATINLINCTADGQFDLDNTQRVTANVFQSKCGIMNFVHGKVTGSTIASLRVYDDASTPLAATDINIIGNDLTYGAIISTTRYAFNAYNNDMSYAASVASSSSTEVTLYGLSVDNMKAGSSNNVINNRIYNETSGVSPSSRYGAVQCTATQSAVLYVANNIITNLSVNTGQNWTVNSNTAAPTLIVVNNLCTNTSVFTGVDTIADNISNGTYTLDLTAGTSTGGIVNAGIADDEYADLDLSRNDIGPLGGSNSWSNYWPTNATNKPRVTYLNTPRRVYNGTTAIPVEAIGISK